MFAVTIGLCVFAIIYLIVGYYWINIRGIYSVSKQVSKKINSFLDNPKVYQGYKEDEFYKYFLCGDSHMKVWAMNWPYAYGSKGVISKDKRIVYRWNGENPSYRTRRRIKDFE